MAFGKDELKEIAKLLREQGKMQESLNDSMDNYVQHLREITELQKNIKHVSEQISNLKSEELDLTNDLKELIKERNKGSDAEIKARRKEIKLIIDKIKAKRVSLSLSEEGLKILEKTNDEYVEQVANVNKVNLGLKEGAKFLAATPALVKKGYGKLKSTGVFEMDKSIRMAALEMGKVADAGSSFGKNMASAGERTVFMGVHLKDLAKLQATFSTELGRSVMLSEDGLVAMGEIAAGTMLGTEGAASLVAEMDRFNISAEAARDIIDETVNMSEKMGVNSTKVLKTLQNNLKMANKYHFKGGVKGMVKMATQAAKFNVSMETTAGLADKLFDIEGAVEMSAKLNTMGGEWAKLGDPMKLMFQARNDMDGLQDSVINATSGMADFNKETGEFEFSGLELHRMRELEKITGIAADEMAEMAKSKAKFSKISADMGFSVAGDPEMKEFIENTATFNKKTKKFEISLDGGKKVFPIDELNSGHKGMMVAESKSLKARAEASQTFDDQMVNLTEQFKQLALPIVEGLNKAIPQIKKAFDDLKTGGWIDKIKSAVGTVGKIVGGAVKFLASFPKTIATILGASVLLSPIKWLFNGYQLAKGFMMGTRGGIGGGVGGSGGLGGAFGKTATHTRGGKGLSGKMGGFGKGMAGKGIGAGMVGQIASMGLDAGRGMMDDPNSEGGKALGVASGALSGAGTGALIGSVVPVIGTAVGAIIGGLVGGLTSAVSEYGGGGSTLQASRGINDGIIADGKITPIDTKDKVFEISKPGGAYDKAANHKPNVGSTSKVEVSIKFDDIMVKSDTDVGRIDLDNDSAFMRELASRVKEALSKTANGGVLSPNPT